MLIVVILFGNGKTALSSFKCNDNSIIPSVYLKTVDLFWNFRFDLVWPGRVSFSIINRYRIIEKAEISFHANGHTMKFNERVSQKSKTKQHQHQQLLQTHNKCKLKKPEYRKTKTKQHKWLCKLEIGQTILEQPDQSVKPMKWTTWNWIYKGERKKPCLISW